MPDSSVSLDPVSTARDIIASNYLFIGAATFLYYDHLITWGDEVNQLWRRPKTKSAYWFFFNRYFALCGNVGSVILEFTNLPPEVELIRFSPFTTANHCLQSCRQFYLFRQIFLVCQQVLVGVLLTLRTYALYRCSFRILVFMLTSGAVLIGISCYSLFGQKSVQTEQSDACRIGLSSVTSIRIASAWEALFVYDSIIFGLTMAQSWKTRNEHGVPISQSPIIYVIFRDGAAYFGVMALANLANILTFYLCGPTMRGGLSVFASAVSVTMMSRLMLNLHRMTIVGIYSMGGTDLTLTNMDINFRTNEVELGSVRGTPATTAQ